MKLSTAEINQSMVDALKGVNIVMEKVNASMDVHSIQQVLKEFAKQSEKMEMQQEMVSNPLKLLNDYYESDALPSLVQMNDAIDMGMDTADDVEAADRVYSQICDEIGVDMGEEHMVGKNKVDPVKSVAVVSYRKSNEFF